jgi:hypothetical protein
MQQELALRAAAGDQVKLTWKDLARKHAGRISKLSASGLRRDFARLTSPVSDARPARRLA